MPFLRCGSAPCMNAFDVFLATAGFARGGGVQGLDKPAAHLPNTEGAGNVCEHAGICNALVITSLPRRPYPGGCLGC